MSATAGSQEDGQWPYRRPAAAPLPPTLPDGRPWPRITIVTRGTPHVLEQIKNQLERIVPVHRVVDLTVVARERGQERPLERELAMVKVAGTGDNRVEALRLADALRAQVIDADTEHFIFEITGRVSKIEQFIAIMKPLGVVEVCRTGVASMNRGPEKM